MYFIQHILSTYLYKNIFILKAVESNFTDSAIAQKINGNKGLECKALQPFPFEEDAAEEIVNYVPDLDLEDIVRYFWFFFNINKC